MLKLAEFDRYAKGERQTTTKKRLRQIKTYDMRWHAVGSFHLLELARQTNPVVK